MPPTVSSSARGQQSQLWERLKKTGRAQKALMGRAGSKVGNRQTNFPQKVAETAWGKQKNNWGGLVGTT